ncbi:MAG: DNA repair protein RecO [Desulfobacula sp.]|nr:DNA repair protein RecO [Desulfobacula sp.]
MPDFTTNAILLKKIEFGDHDFIISFLTKSNGKISVIAKNAKKSIKRFSGPFDIFCENYIQCSFPKKKKDGMLILAKSDIEKGFAQIRYDIFKTAYASFWIELLNFYLEENKPQADLYDLLLFALEALNNDTISKEVLNLLFQIKFMHIAGFSPNIENCDKCQTLIDDFEQKNIRFDFKEGEIICKNCLNKGSEHGMTISKGTLKQLFWIKKSDIQKADRIKFSSFAIKEGGILLEAFIPFHMGRDFKSLKFLRKIRNKIKT